MAPDAIEITTLPEKYTMFLSRGLILCSLKIIQLKESINIFNYIKELNYENWNSL